MQRRTFLAACVGLLLSPWTGMAMKRKYGYMNVRKHQQHWVGTGEFLHVYLNGVDETDRCFEANDQTGYVHLYCRDARQHTLHVKLDPPHLGCDGGFSRLCSHRVWNTKVEFRPGPAPCRDKGKRHET